jgi:hypothetical protein
MIDLLARFADSADLRKLGERLLVSAATTNFRVFPWSRDYGSRFLGLFGHTNFLLLATFGPVRSTLSGVQLSHAWGLSVSRSNFRFWQLVGILAQRVDENQSSAAGFHCTDFLISNQRVNRRDAATDHG